MTPEQALQNLYQAARSAPLTADQHELVLKAAQTLQAAITQPKGKEEVVVAPKEPKNEKDPTK